MLKRLNADMEKLLSISPGSAAVIGGFILVIVAVLYSVAAPWLNEPTSDARATLRDALSGRVFEVRVRTSLMTHEEADSCLGWVFVRDASAPRHLAFIVGRGPGRVEPSQWRHGAWMPPADSLIMDARSEASRRADRADPRFVHLSNGEVLLQRLTNGNRPLIQMAPAAGFVVLERAEAITWPRARRRLLGTARP